MRKHLFLFLLLLHAIAWADDGALRQRIDLAGVWQFALDPQASLAPTDILDDTIVLPGTTDTNLKGTPPSNTSETTHLTRLHAYVGRAWYRREVTIPKTWKRKQVVMVLERTKPAVVYVDGMKAG